MKHTLEADLQPLDDTSGPYPLDCPVTVYEGTVSLELPDVGVLSIPVEEFRRLAAVVEHEEGNRSINEVEAYRLENAEVFSAPPRWQR